LKVINVDTSKSSSAVLVTVSSKSVFIFKRFYAKLVDINKNQAF